MVTGIMEKNTSDLADVELKNHINGKWEAITSSWRSVLDRLPNQRSIELKLNWVFNRTFLTLVPFSDFTTLVYQHFIHVNLVFTGINHIYFFVHVTYEENFET